MFSPCSAKRRASDKDLPVQMMCGIWGDYCDATKLFDFIGDVNAFSPFQISYLFTDNHEPIDGHKPNDRDLRTCADPIPGMFKMSYLYRVISKICDWVKYHNRL